jgi:hypothetical protein
MGSAIHRQHDRDGIVRYPSITAFFAGPDDH